MFTVIRRVLTVNIVGHGGVNMLGGTDFDRSIVNSIIRPWLLESFIYRPIFKKTQATLISFELRHPVRKRRRSRYQHRPQVQSSRMKTKLALATSQGTISI
jgi:hypothetical protein